MLPGSSKISFPEKYTFVPLLKILSELVEEIIVHELKLNVYPLFLLLLTFIVPKLTFVIVPEIPFL